MILILGGAWQGKLTWAARTYHLSSEDILNLAEKDPAPGYRCYTHLEAWTARVDGIPDIPDCFENAIVISREIGSGVVPVDQQQRFRRERHGRFLRKLTAASDHVYRIICELPETLK